MASSNFSRSYSVTKLTDLETRPAHSVSPKGIICTIYIFNGIPILQLVRSSSLLDVNNYSRSIDRFAPARSFLVHNDSRPLWDHTFYRDVLTGQQPRFYRPAYLMDNHWYDKYYYFSPKYRGTQPYKHHYARQ